MNWLMNVDAAVERERFLELIFVDHPRRVGTEQIYSGLFGTAPLILAAYIKQVWAFKGKQIKNLAAAAVVFEKENF